LPDGSGRFFGRSGGPRINNSGDIVFTALFTGASPYRGIFLSSGGTLRMVVDQLTPIPGAAGQHFDTFNSVWINDAGDIAFEANMFSNSPPSGIFLVSGGNLQTVLLNTVGSDPSISFNNNGDIAVTTFEGGIPLYSGGKITSVVTRGQAVSNSNFVVQ